MVNQLGESGVSHIKFTIRKLFGVENEIRELADKQCSTRTEIKIDENGN